MTKDPTIELMISALRKLTRDLSKICRNRIEYPDDSERVDDLKDALLEGHRILSTINEQFGAER